MLISCFWEKPETGLAMCVVFMIKVYRILMNFYAYLIDMF